MLAEASLVDTNVLVYSIYEGSPQHAASRRLLERCQGGQQPLCVATQNLVEFFATTTNPKRVTAPYKPVDALTLIRQVLSIPNLTVLPSPPDLHERWLALLDMKPVAGNKCFDVQLIATMLANGIRRVFTYNTGDFARFADLEVLEP
jgi:toxin-antitoxin system PIN domain toxin